MDPKATFNEMLRATLSKDTDRVEECARSLLKWLDDGGFTPRFESFAHRSEEEQLALIRRTCKGQLLLVDVWRQLEQELK